MIQVYYFSNYFQELQQKHAPGYLCVLKFLSQCSPKYGILQGGRHLNPSDEQSSIHLPRFVHG